MRIYETTFVVNPQTDDATINGRVQAVSGLITKNGGKIVVEDHMGTRRLAYPIQGLTQGYYGSFIFEGPASILPLIDRLYKQEEAYVRYITVLYEADPQELLDQRATMGMAEDIIPDHAEAAPELPRPIAQRRPEPTGPRIGERKPVDVVAEESAPIAPERPSIESRPEPTDTPAPARESADEDDEEL